MNRREKLARHGLSRTPEYAAWKRMLNRCRGNQEHKYYKDLGVVVCQKWTDSFEAFLADVGPRPSPEYSLDRYPDPHGNYEPGNVRWTTAAEQARNRRNNVLLTLDGVTMTVAEWSRQQNIPVPTLHRRLRAGWSDEEALTRPIDEKHRSRF